MKIMWHWGGRGRQGWKGERNRECVRAVKEQHFMSTFPGLAHIHTSAQPLSHTSPYHFGSLSPPEFMGTRGASKTTYHACFVVRTLLRFVKWPSGYSGNTDNWRRCRLNLNVILSTRCPEFKPDFLWGSFNRQQYSVKVDVYMLAALFSMRMVALLQDATCSCVVQSPGERKFCSQIGFHIFWIRRTAHEGKSVFVSPRKHILCLSGRVTLSVSAWRLERIYWL